MNKFEINQTNKNMKNTNKTLVNTVTSVLNNKRTCLIT